MFSSLAMGLALTGCGVQTHRLGDLQIDYDVDGRHERAVWKVDCRREKNVGFMAGTSYETSAVNNAFGRVMPNGDRVVFSFKEDLCSATLTGWLLFGLPARDDPWRRRFPLNPAKTYAAALPLRDHLVAPVTFFIAGGASPDAGVLCWTGQCRGPEARVHVTHVSGKLSPWWDRAWPGKRDGRALGANPPAVSALACWILPPDTTAALRARYPGLGFTLRKAGGGPNHDLEQVAAWVLKDEGLPLIALRTGLNPSDVPTSEDLLRWPPGYELTPQERAWARRCEPARSGAVTVSGQSPAATQMLPLFRVDPEAPARERAEGVDSAGHEAFLAPPGGVSSAQERSDGSLVIVELLSPPASVNYNARSD